jgi:hypothetical protein
VNTHFAGLPMELQGAFHLTEIPEILLSENQMEHVNFWNDMMFRKFRTIFRGCPQIGNSGSFEIFYIPLKHFPTTFLLSSLRRTKPATKTKMADSRPFQCLESGFISPNAEKRDLSRSVKFFKIKETAFQK